MKKISFITLVLCTLMLPSIFCMKKHIRKRFSPNNLRRSGSSRKQTNIYTELRNILNKKNLTIHDFFTIEDKIYSQDSARFYKIYIQFLVTNSRKIKNTETDNYFDEIPSKFVPLLIAHFPTTKSWMDIWLEKIGKVLLYDTPIAQSFFEILVDDNDTLAIGKLLNYLLEKGNSNNLRTRLFIINLFIKPFENNAYANLLDYALKQKKYKSAYRVLRFFKDRLGKNLNYRFKEKFESMKSTLNPNWYKKFMNLINI